MDNNFIESELNTKCELNQLFFTIIHVRLWISQHYCEHTVSVQLNSTLISPPAVYCFPSTLSEPCGIYCTPSPVCVCARACVCVAGQMAMPVTVSLSVGGAARPAGTSTLPPLTHTHTHSTSSSSSSTQLSLLLLTYFHAPPHHSSSLLLHGNIRGSPLD